MIDRKKKLRIIQFSLLIFSLIIIYLTYYNKEDSNTDLVEAEQVKELFQEHFGMQLITIEAKQRFYNLLAQESDPEKKRQYDTFGAEGFNQRFSQDDIFQNFDLGSIFR